MNLEGVSVHWRAIHCCKHDIRMDERVVSSCMASVKNFNEVH